jgi:hypothetical protein
MARAFEIVGQARSSRVAFVRSKPRTRGADTIAHAAKWDADSFADSSASVSPAPSILPTSSMSLNRCKQGGDALVDHRGIEAAREHCRELTDTPSSLDGSKARLARCGAAQLVERRSVARAAARPEARPGVLVQA